MSGRAGNDPISVSIEAGALAAIPPLVQLVVMIKPYFFCIAIFGLTGCGSEPDCSSRLLQVARDIDGHRYAATSVRNCGATTAYATVVHVGRSGEPQSAATEVFVADSNNGAATEVFQGAIWTNVVWTASGKLSISHRPQARIFKQVGEAAGVSISFRASDPIWVPAVP